MKFTRYIAGAMVCVALLYTLGIFRRRDIDLPEVHRESGPILVFEKYGDYQGS